MFTSRPIGYALTPYKDTASIPHGPGAQHTAEGTLEILREFVPGLADIEGFSHLYLLWEFDCSEGFDLLVTPPTDTQPHGLFATRAPRRPNPIALTIVELVAREGLNGSALRVRGLDMLDGTPILDIKPCMSPGPNPERLRRGWLDRAEALHASGD